MCGAEQRSRNKCTCMFERVIVGITFFDWTLRGSYLIIRLFEHAPRLSLRFLHHVIPKATWKSHPTAFRKGNHAVSIHE